ncbi:hypothetical protein [Streptacidiphilus neutrinimicus]|uniref:hypothetical protein n=1 Tax=Streptacidiphilus neutrinimicus TaxID=105420 RepID=UPI0005A62A77|nr:hypothetical protein [Streptacidiphilus neutrinimicus]
MTTVGERVAVLERPQEQESSGAGAAAEVGGPARSPGRGRVRKPLTTPARLRWAAAGCAVLALLLGWALVGASTGASDAWDRITRHEAPQVTDAGALYQSLTDLDAQAANQLMFGDDPKLAANLATARQQYATDRTDADKDLQQATLDASGNTAAQTALAAILDGMGRYQDLAARALELDSHANAPAGHPDPSALAEYRQAEDLMRGGLLPAAHSLVQANDQAFEQSYTDERGALGTAALWLTLLGGGLLAALVATQVWLAIRFRRVVNPALAAASVLVAVLLSVAGSFLDGERQDLFTARKDAYDSVVALTQARAIVADSNAAESRYVLDVERRAQYQSDFVADTDQILSLDGAQLGAYDTALASAVAAVKQNPADIRFGGEYGREFHNITFPGEGAAAMNTLLAFQAYQADDRRIRALVASGRLEDAIAYCTSLAPGGSNADFDAHDAALRRLIGINEQAYVSASTTGAKRADTALWVQLGCVAGALVLLGAGVRPRLREFR